MVEKPVAPQKIVPAPKEPLPGPSSVLSMESRRAQSKTAGCVLTYEAVLSQRSWISGSRFHLSILKPDKVDSSSYQAH